MVNTQKTKMHVKKKKSESGLLPGRVNTIPLLGEFIHFRRLGRNRWSLKMGLL